MTALVFREMAQEKTIALLEGFSYILTEILQKVAEGGLGTL